MGGRRAKGLRVKDPHSAQQLPDGRVVISDSGHNRLLFVDPYTGNHSTLKTVTGGGVDYRLHNPKYAEVTDDGSLVIVDTANHPVLIASLEGELLCELSQVPGSPIPTLNAPRWAQLTGLGEIVVSDHAHHRIVHLRRVVG